MPRNYDDDRPKKTWRELDNAKDRSAHRAPDKTPMSPFKQARADSASKSYKSKLDAFFDGDGKVPTIVKDKLANIQDTSLEGAARTLAIKAIKDASTSHALDEAFARFLEHWELPFDFDVLSQALNCGDESYIAAALDTIDKMFKDKRIPKHVQLLEQRLRRVKTLSEEPDLQEKAAALMKTLRLFS
jgi:hypothetical protein